MSSVPQPAASPDILLERLRGISGSADPNVWLRNRPDLVGPKSVEVLAEAVRQQVRVDVDEAMRMSEAAIAIANLLGEPEPLGRACRARANALWYKNDLRAAVAMFDQAVTHFETAERPDEVGRTLSSSIQSLLLLGNYDRALEAAGRARTIFDQINDSLRLARLDINVANIYHRQDRFAEALASYQRAYDQLLPLKDAEGTAVALHNIAVCLIVLNDFERALETWRRAREASERNGMPLLAAQADYNIAYLYFMRGDYETALDGLRASRERCRQNGDFYHAGLCDLDQSEIYLELNLPSEAALLAQSAREEFDKMGMDFETARSIANLAIARHRQHAPEQALKLFETAGAIFQQADNQPWQMLLVLYQAVVLFETGAPADALRLSFKALDYFEGSRLERRAVLCHLLIARVSIALGDPGVARDHSNAALRKIATLEAPLLNYEAHLLLGRIERASGAPREAYRSFQDARLQLETLRSSLQGEELKISFFGNKLDVYENLIDLCLSEDIFVGTGESAREEAFVHMEHAKSRTLLEAVSGRANPLRWRATHGPDGDRLRTLRSELNWYYRRIELELTSKEVGRPEQIDNLWSEARKREDQLLRFLREVPRSEHDTFLPQPGSMTVAQVRKALGPEAALLEYTQVGPDLIAAVLTHDRLEFENLGPVSGIGNSIRGLHFQLSKPGLSRVQSKSFLDQLLAATDARLAELYTSLISPIARLLKGRHLILVPHGILHCVPFHALSEAGEYLIDRFTISYSPSASIYAACQRNTARRTADSLLLGVSDKRTPWIPKEIRSIASVLPGPAVYSGRRATSEVLRAAGPNSRFIHIATHGYFRADNPMFSSVRLADGHLNLHDLYTLRLPAELITLSGCGTGLNAVSEGDELLGLTRGLLGTGAESLLLTYWDVHDRTTAMFMATFYGCLMSGSEKATALKTAMLEVRKVSAHPYYWAPFFLVGKAIEKEA